MDHKFVFSKNKLDVKLKILFVVLSLALSVFLIFKIKKELIIHRSLSYSLQQVNIRIYYEFDNLKNQIIDLKKKDKYLDAKYDNIQNIWIDTQTNKYEYLNSLDSTNVNKFNFFASIKRLKSNIKINLYKDSLQTIYNSIISKVNVGNYTPLCFIKTKVENDSISCYVQVIENMS